MENVLNGLEQGYAFMTKLFEVVWVDANFSDGYGICDAEKVKPVLARTTGYLAYDCPEYVTIAMTIVPGEDDCVTEQIAIPKGMIKEMREL